jgi:membrane-associated phospholipid phosphatase
MKRTLIIFLVAPFILSSHLHGQNRYNLSQFGDETVAFVKQPLKWNSNDWLRVGLAGAGTYLLMQLDDPVRNSLMEDRRYIKSVPVEFGRLWGEVVSTFVIAGGFALHGATSGDNSSEKIGFEIAQSALYAGGITTVLKSIFGRARPYTERGPSVFQPFTIPDDDFHALPSGHTTLAFALSTVLSRNVGSPALKVIAYLPAVLTAFSRMYQDKHWTSDCLLGGIIGYAVASWVVDQHERNEHSLSVTSVYPLTIRIVLN